MRYRIKASLNNLNHFRDNCFAEFVTLKFQAIERSFYQWCDDTGNSLAQFDDWVSSLERDGASYWVYCDPADFGIEAVQD